MRLRLNYWYWLTLLLVGSMIISVSPITSTTSTTTFLRTSLKAPMIKNREFQYQSSESESSALQIINSNRITSFEKKSSKFRPLENHYISHSTKLYDSIFLDTHQLEPSYKAIRRERDIELNDDSGFDKCRPFREGDIGQNTLYSPDYPSNYPKNINCTKIIEAPRGQLIRLDFRNTFNIEEKEDCKFDYLEIRDGPYGFSNLIGRYCGEEFPPMITSKERHLWMHFHSDESIEYSGFTAVYEFIDRPKEAISTELNCTIEKDGFEGFINSTDVPQYVLSNVTRNKIPLDCMWIIRVKEKWKIQVKFLHFSLNKPNDCDINFIDIFAEDTNIPSRVKNFCGSTGESVSSETNLLHIRFFAEPIAMNSSFEILYTAFRDKGTASCVEDEYDCEDATCISADLKCNGRDNCKFRWDEEGCQGQIGGQSEHVIIIIVVFVLILGGMVVTFLVNCVRKLLQDQKIIREHVRQSKESKLDEMGRRSLEKHSRENLSVKLSPREKHSQTSLQILDDVSNRFYREINPISVQTSKSDIKADSILRQHHDIVVQTSLGSDDTPLSDRGVCDMGCQTRESLFQPVARQKSITSPSPNQSASAIRFSTFGYDKPLNNKAQTLSRQSTIARLPSESIEMDERHRSHQRQLHNSGVGQDISAARMPQEICHHHHQHQQHLQKQQQSHHQSDVSQQQQQQTNQTHHQHGHHHHHHTLQALSGSGNNKGKQKVDESKAFIDIRNSAPDVIIMTSH